MKEKIIILIFFICLLFIVILVIRHDKQGQSDKVQGYVDSITIVNNLLVVEGWFGTDANSGGMTSILVFLSGKQVYEEVVKPYARPDVARETGMSQWLLSGWRVSVDISQVPKEKQRKVDVQVRLKDGKLVALPLGPQAQLIATSRSGSEQFWHIWAIRCYLVVLFLITCTGYLYASNIADWMTAVFSVSVRPPVVFSGFLIFLFSLIVHLGLTGSSINLGIKATPFVQSNMLKIWGTEQAIRSDEWLVWTPLAIGQYNHSPKFPIVNKNLGEEGQNMLVAMNVPVAHVSTIAKPITWGFFIFDLQRALSWYWFFPVFSCLFALWAVASLLMGCDWKSGFCVSFLFVISPYVTAWSNIPANAVFFPSICILLFVAIFKTNNNNLLLTVLSFLLGIALSGFILILYPPWQVSLGYVYLFLLAGIVVRDKLYRLINYKILIAILGSIFVCALIVLLWWLDAKEAVSIITNTVYPGQRVTILGGNYSFSELLRGFTNIITMSKLDSGFSNKSEIASFFYLFLPLSYLYFWKLFKNEITAVETSIFFAIILIIFFMFVGLPQGLSNFTLWGRVPPKRADIALGLSSILLTGMLVYGSKNNTSFGSFQRLMAFVVAILWSLFAFYSINMLDNSIISGFTNSLFLGIICYVTATGYFLALTDCKKFTWLNILWCFIIILPFIPISIAPTRLHVDSTFQSLLEGRGKKLRTLVVSSQVQAMFLMAAGEEVANGVFYYPQSVLWDRLDKAHVNSQLYNRYQHLIFSANNLSEKNNFLIKSPSPDVVNVIFDPKFFDFCVVNSDVVLTPANIEASFRENRSLNYNKNYNKWSIFNVTNQCNHE